MNFLSRSLITFPIAMFLLLAQPLRAAEDAAATTDDKHVDPEKAAKIGDQLAPSFVHVEYTLQYDRGEPPVAGTWSGMYRRGGPEQVIRDDRSYDVAGFLLSNDTVMTPDQMIHPRFVKKIAVRLGDEVVDATPASVSKDHGALTLKLAKPLKGGKPLTFDKSKAGPYLAIGYGEGETDSEWIMSAQPLMGAARTDSGKRFMMVPGASLIVDKTGVPVGMAMRERLAADDSWKGSPAEWPAYSAEEMAKLTTATQAAAQKGLLSVTLNFRSPKAKPGSRDMFVSRGDPSNQENAAQRHVVGVAIDPQTILVLADLKANVTARLEKIKVQGPDGKPINAKFKLSMLDYGVFVATLDKPLPDAPTIGKSDISSLRYVALPAAQILLQGEKRVEYFDHRRLTQFYAGWHNQVYPEMTNGSQNLFLFDPAGALTLVPVLRRERDGNQERWGNQDQALLTPVSYLLKALADPAKNGDPANIPLSETEENRLAWLGVELQALTPELARANDVSHLTNDGRTGAVVTYLYPDSPAAKAGIESGDVLLRIRVDGQPKPLDVMADPGQFGDQPFPWDQLDQLPEQYFDQIPQPWPGAENNLSRMLTDLGFGKKFTVEFARGGKQMEKELAVSQSPPHFEAAAKYKSDGMGVTVRDLTYEVKRYFQKAEDEPGVIISKIEMGSKASTAGLKPYEVITHVNDVAVNNVKDFEKAVKDQKQLRLSIKRMTKGRQVKIKLPEKGEEPEKPAKAPAVEEKTEDAADGGDAPVPAPKRGPVKPPVEEK